jgi:hypothetical protein
MAALHLANYLSRPNRRRHHAKSAHVMALLIEMVSSGFPQEPLIVARHPRAIGERVPAPLAARPR